ncbi:MAG: hypothetical protein M1431_03805 [Candidatus Thermoplasmatota archaeon]|nr:hypothetical protein [Candidatus Thermoplasmatota archaeon]
MQPKVKLFDVGPKFYGPASDFIRTGHGSFFCLMNPGIVKSLEQIFIAYERSMRIFRESRVKNVEALFLMLMSGETQISKALMEAGIDQKLRRVVAVYDSTDDLERLQRIAGNEMKEIEIGPGMNLEDNDDMIFTRMVKVQLSLMFQHKSPLD